MKKRLVRRRACEFAFVNLFTPPTVRLSATLVHRPMILVHDRSPMVVEGITTFSECLMLSRAKVTRPTDCSIPLHHRLRLVILSLLVLLLLPGTKPRRYLFAIPGCATCIEPGVVRMVLSVAPNL